MVANGGKWWQMVANDFILVQMSTHNFEDHRPDISYIRRWRLLVVQSSTEIEIEIEIAAKEGSSNHQAYHNGGGLKPKYRRRMEQIHHIQF
jgi:hypothetical protein